MNRAFIVIHFPNNPLNDPAHPEKGSHSSRVLRLTAVIADVPQSATRLKQHLLVLAGEQLNQWGNEACLHTWTPHELCQETNTAQISLTHTNTVPVRKELNQTWAFYGPWAISGPLTTFDVRGLHRLLCDRRTKYNYTPFNNQGY